VTILPVPLIKRESINVRAAMIIGVVERFGFFIFKSFRVGEAPLIIDVQLDIHRAANETGDCHATLHQEDSDREKDQNSNKSVKRDGRLPVLQERLWKGQPDRGHSI
jgi:hypothetical protein